MMNKKGGIFGIDIIKLIGWDRETKRLIWRNIYYNFSLLLFLFLAYDAFFIREVFMDAWGFDSHYITKLLLGGIILFSIYFWWGYIQLNSRVSELEDTIAKSKTQGVEK